MEKTLDLKMPGVVELGIEELKVVEGGGIGVLLGAIALAAYMYDNREKAKQGVKDALDEFFKFEE